MSTNCGQNDAATVRLEARLAALTGADIDTIPQVLAEIAEAPMQNIYQPPADSHTRACAAFLGWANEHVYLKDSVSDIPVGILPAEYDPARLHDVRVNPTRKMQTDDMVYASDEEVRRRVARGNCFLELGGEAAGSIECVVQSLRKFTGGLGDDDDATDEVPETSTRPDDPHAAAAAAAAAESPQPLWQRFFLKPFGDVKTVVVMEKANGEAAHLSVRRVKDSFVLFPGSKNVHIAVCTAADVAKWEGTRFNVARHVANAMFAVLDALPPADLHRLLAFMAVTKLTATFEMLQPSYQHVVYLGAPDGAVSLRFLGWTSTRLHHNDQVTLCAIHPAVGLEIARHLGFTPVSAQTIDMSTLETHTNMIRNGYNSEGAVLYFVDHAGAVVGLVKKKTAWYVFLRACREKVKAAARQYTKECDRPQGCDTRQLLMVVQRKLQARFAQVRDWLCVDDACLAAYLELTLAYLAWAVAALERDACTLRDFEAGFPVTWRRFLTETQAVDKITATNAADM